MAAAVPGLSLWLGLRAAWWLRLGDCWAICPWLLSLGPHQILMGIPAPGCWGAASTSLATPLAPSCPSLHCWALPQALRIHPMEKGPGLCHTSDLLGASQPFIGRYFRKGFLLLTSATHFSFNIGQIESLLDNETEQISMTHFCIVLQK